MLEVKAKEQGHRRKCSPKKEKGHQIFFQAISKEGLQKRSSQIFRKVSGVYLHNFKIEQIPILLEPMQMHITLYEFLRYKTSTRGSDSVYCASKDLNFCNVGNKLTFRTNTRE